ncbi:hypothetical protein ACROYT_G006820 [Oculina patagonica]
MRTVVLAFSLAFLVPALSLPASDCINCADCRSDNKCHKCDEGFALTKIYVRRLCVRQSECYGGKENGMVWDPVLSTYICDQKRDCKAPLSWPNCVECLASGSCTKCKENFALKLWSKNHIGHNVCDGNCEKCVDLRSGAQVCKTSAASCAPSATQSVPSPTTAAVVNKPTNDAVTTPNPAPTTDGTSTDYSEYTEPTADGTLDDDY